jgi:hypothetical protein
MKNAKHLISNVKVAFSLGVIVDIEAISFAKTLGAKTYF